MTDELTELLPPDVHLCRAIASLWNARNHLSFVDEHLAAIAASLLSEAILSYNLSYNRILEKKEQNAS